MYLYKLCWYTVGTKKHLITSMMRGGGCVLITLYIDFAEEHESRREKRKQFVSEN